MAIPQVLETGANRQAAPSRTTNLDRDAFLQLLVAQMKHQDPLNPMEDKEFVAQLAQFSSLEQLFQVNENLKTNSVLAQTANNSLMASLIGKSVRVVGNMLHFKEESSPQGSFELASAADVTVSIKDINGQNVRTMSLGYRDKGTHDFVWNGKDDSGKMVIPGEYTFEVIPVAGNGQMVNALELMQGTVQQVRFSNGEAVVVFDDMEIGPDQIYEISLANQNN